jgi:hypothetical protein
VKNKKYAIMPGIISIALVVALLSASSTWIRTAWCSPADSYGNDITYAEVWQHNGTAWNLVENFTSSGGSTRIHDGWQVKFYIGLKLNSTLAASQAEAIDFTRVYMNITYIGGSVWTNKELNNTSCSGPSGGFYYLEEEGLWNMDLPVAGRTYTCDVKAQFYY